MKSVLVLIILFACALDALASPTLIQPDESTSKDVFVYEFLPALPAGNFNGGGFGALLASGKTGIGHDLRTLLQFDLAGASLNPGEQALLNLYVGSTTATGFGIDPSPAAPVTTEIHYNLGAWDESTVTWGTAPAAGSTIIASQSISGVNQWVTFDVTPLVQAWLATPATNLGFSIIQTAVVNNGGLVAAVYDSSAGANKPFLQITPEPASLAWIAIGAVIVKRRRHR